MVDVKQLMQARWFRWLRVLFVFGLVVNALDYFAGLHLVPRNGLIVRPSFLAVTRFGPVQLWGVWLLVALILMCLPRWTRAWMSWKVPVVARIFLTAVLLFEAYHILVRKEVFPFTNVSMYSIVRVRPMQETHRDRSYFIKHDGEFKEFNLFREGNRVLSQWVYIGPKIASLSKRRFANAKAVDYINEQVTKAGYESLHQGWLEIDWETLEVIHYDLEATVE